MILVYTASNGRLVARKVAADMLPSFKAPNDMQAPNILAEHKLKPEEQRLAISQLMLLYPFNGSLLCRE